MTIKKAIEILELNLREAGSGMPSDCKEAVQLSVEALKRHLDRDYISFNGMMALLPGETEED
ncbi:hypothetical protein ES703_125247 [subsurface metagenome]